MNVLSWFGFDIDVLMIFCSASFIPKKMCFLPPKHVRDVLTKVARHLLQSAVELHAYSPDRHLPMPTLASIDLHLAGKNTHCNNSGGKGGSRGEEGKLLLKLLLLKISAIPLFTLPTVCLCT